MAGYSEVSPFKPDLNQISSWLCQLALFICYFTIAKDRHKKPSNLCSAVTLRNCKRHWYQPNRNEQICQKSIAGNVEWPTGFSRIPIAHYQAHYKQAELCVSTPHLNARLWCWRIRTRTRGLVVRCSVCISVAVIVAMTWADIFARKKWQIWKHWFQCIHVMFGVPDQHIL